MVDVLVFLVVLLVLAARLRAPMPAHRAGPARDDRQRMSADAGSHMQVASPMSGAGSESRRAVVASNTCTYKGETYFFRSADDRAMFLASLDPSGEFDGKAPLPRPRSIERRA